MTSFANSIAVACLAGALMSPSLAAADAATAAPEGEAVVSTVEATATVAKIDHKTREVTLRNDDGEEFSFVAGEDVTNLPQVKAGDRVKVAYTEALAYEVKMGGAAADLGSTVAGGAAEPGAKPAGMIAQQTKVTVLITAIDPKVPSVTFQGPGGNTRTIKVRRPEKLEGVNVGDTVELTYTEALAIKVEEMPKN
jgi:Cu/Ag efflux protein CusF